MSHNSMNPEQRLQTQHGQSWQLLFFLAVCGYWSSFAPCFGQVGGRPTSIEMQIEKLERELAELQTAVDAKKHELERARAALEAARKRSSNDARGETIASAADILKQLPAELQPHRTTGWDSIALEGVPKWLEANGRGGEVAMRIKARFGTFSRNRSVNDPTAPDAWTLDVYLTSTNTSRFGPYLVSEAIIPSKIRLPCSYDFTKRASALKAWFYVDLKAKLTASSIYLAKQKLTMTMRLSDVALDSPLMPK